MCTTKYNLHFCFTDLSLKNPEPAQTSLYPHMPLPEYYHPIYVLVFQSGPFLSGFTTKTLYTPFSTTHVTRLAHLIPLHLVIILSHSSNYGWRTLTTLAVKRTVVSVEIWVQLHPFLTQTLDVSFTIRPLKL
jgi:ribosomal protein L31